MGRGEVVVVTIKELWTDTACVRLLSHVVRRHNGTAASSSNAGVVKTYPVRRCYQKSSRARSPDTISASQKFPVHMILITLRHLRRKPVITTGLPKARLTSSANSS